MLIHSVIRYGFCPYLLLGYREGAYTFFLLLLKVFAERRCAPEPLQRKTLAGQRDREKLFFHGLPYVQSSGQGNDVPALI